MPWVPWTSSASSPPPPPPPPPSHASSSFPLNTNSSAVLTSLDAQLGQFSPFTTLALGISLGVVLGLGTRHAYVRHLKRVKNNGWVTPDMLKNKRWIKGYVTSVGDPDNFRLYHTPGIWRIVPTKRKGLTQQTLHIRIAGVDAPEMGHFGKPPQPYAQDSLQWLKGRIQGRTLYCQLLQRDQYGRIVASVHVKPRILPSWLVKGKSVGLEMMREGWAAVYKQKGGVFGEEGQEVYTRLEEEAKAAKRGMWKDGVQELPSEYKRHHREGTADILDSNDTDVELGSPEEVDVTRGGRTRDWLSRIFRR